jgi:hypothetical protein
METNLLGMTASTKQKNDFSNAIIGLAWMLTSLLILRPVTDVKFAELMTAHCPLFCQACRNPLSLITESTLIFLALSKLLTVVRNLFCA